MANKAKKERKVVRACVLPIPPTARDLTANLPTEIKQEIVYLLRSTAHLKNLSLVNRAWKDIVLPILWNKFSTPLTANEKQFDILVSPTSNILKCLRYLQIRGSKNVPKTEERLSELLLAIKAGQLRGFKSDQHHKRSTFSAILRMFPKLEVLEIWGSGEGVEYAGNASRHGTIPGCFSKLTNLSISITGDVSTSAVQALIFHCASLKSVTVDNITQRQVSSSSVLEPSGDVDSGTAMQKQGPELSSLSLKNLVISANLNSMCRRIDMSALTELALRNCSEAHRLVHRLSIFEFRINIPLLSSLTIVQPPSMAPQMTFNCIQALLDSFYGLRKLHIVFMDAPTFDVQAIIRHGRTLKYLCIVNDRINRRGPTKCFSAEDIHQITTGCPHIEQLCLNLYELHVGDMKGADQDLVGSFPTRKSKPTKFEVALASIAQLRSLHTVRLTNPKSYSDAYDGQRGNGWVRGYLAKVNKGEFRNVFQATADSIMRYLAERGSNIKVLAFSPTEKTAQSEKKDWNGHLFPDFYYFRGTVTDGMGTNMAVARPTTTWEKDFPGSTILIKDD